MIRKQPVIKVDTVGHDYGVKGTVNNWFSSYFENRTQFVSINRYSSDLRFIHRGVPQGSIFGCLLFLAYIMQ